MKLSRFKALYYKMVDFAEELNAEQRKDKFYPTRVIMWNAVPDTADHFGVLIREGNNLVGLKRVSEDGIIKEEQYVVIPQQAIPELIKTLSAVMLRLPLPTDTIEIKLKEL